MRKYLKIGLVSMQTSFIYRENYVITALIKIISVILTILVWHAVYDNTDLLLNENFNQTVLYIVITNCIFDLVNCDYVSSELSDEILNGKISALLIRPYSFIGDKLSSTFGKKASAVPMYLVIYIIIGFLIILSQTIQYRIYITFSKILICMGLVIMAVILDFFLNFILGMLCFNIENPYIIFFVKSQLVSLVSGTVVPIYMFPEKIQILFSYLPFQFLGYFQSSLLTEQVDVRKIIRGVGIMILYLLGLSMIAVILWKKQIKRYRAVGG